MSAYEREELLELLKLGPVWVCGAGVAGQGCLKLLSALNISCTVVDDNTGIDSVQDVLTVVQACDLIREDADSTPGIIVTSPGWNPANPLFGAASEKSIPIIGDIELAWVIDQSEELGQAHHWLTITGTNGKTTTTAMLTDILDCDGRDALSVGNIGYSACQAVLESSSRWFVAEVSSFQMHWTHTFIPEVGCVLNIAEDHLDWHGSFEGYAQDKLKVLRAQQAIIALNDPYIVDYVHTHPEFLSAQRYGFVVSPTPLHDPALERDELSGLVEAHDNTLNKTTDIVYFSEETGDSAETIATLSQLSPPGPAGQMDAAAASAMALATGVDPQSIATALRSFRVDKHRGQIVSSGPRGQWIDNSKATNPHAAQAALQGLSHVIWVAGGQLKDAAVDDLIAGIKDSLDAVILLGVDRQLIGDELRTQGVDVPVILIEDTDPEAAMQLVVQHAQKLASSSSNVVLAPAGASLDMYTGMSQRGDLFAHFAQRAQSGELS